MTKLADRVGALLYRHMSPRWLDRSMFDYIPKTGKVLNVGSGNTVLGENVINLDIKLFPNVDVVADAHNLPFDDAEFDCVFCNAVLEHTIQPWVVASELQRVLKAGGIICVQTPFLEGVHDESDYFRFTLKGLLSLFPDVVVIKSGVSASINQILADLMRNHPVLVVERTPLRAPMVLVAGLLTKPMQFLDFAVRGSPSAYKYARAVYLVGRKRTIK